MLAGKPILLNTLSDLPRVARQESEILAVQNIKSLMVVPFGIPNGCGDISALIW